MARAGKVLSATGSLPLGGDDEPDDKGPSLLVELQDAEDAEIHVYQSTEGQANAREAWCFSCGPQDFTWPALLEKIRNDYGAGLYSIRARIGTKWLGRRVVKIVGRPGAPAPSAIAPAPTSPAAPAGVDVMARFQEMQLQQAQQFQNLMLAIIPKLGGGGGGESVADKILMVMLPKLLEGKADPIGELERLAKLRDLLGGDRDGGGDGQADWLKEAFGLVKPIAQMTMMNAVQQHQPPPAGAPGVARAPAPASTRAPALTNVRPRQPPNAMGDLVGLVLRGAATGANPKPYAVVVLDHVEPRAAAMLLAQPDPLKAFLGMAPQAAPHAAWLTQLLEQLQVELKARQERGGLTSPSTGEQRQEGGQPA